MDLKTILAKAAESQASDILIVVGMPPIIRINTNLIMMKDAGDIDRHLAQQMLASMLDEEKLKFLNENRDIDFSTKADDGTRFRVNVHYQKGSLAMAFRVIKSAIPDINTLGLPPIVQRLAHLPRGLILVTGPTGSGKSTTLASMIDQINQHYCKHIITVEDPIEYDFISNASVVEQREIGFDCPSFASALKHVLRQNPDVILVGEMCDLETTSAAIRAAEAGHLVFSTLHTISAARTIGRIIDIYPANQQNHICSMLVNTLQAVISQTLFERVDQPGMLPATEILICNRAVRSCIRENRLVEMTNIIETNQRLGMQSLDKQIAEMVQQGYIDSDEALAKCCEPAQVRKLLSSTPQLY